MNLFVFMTFSMSIKKWAETGLLEREIALYKKFIEKGYSVTLVSYGGEEDYYYENIVAPIRILPVYSIVEIPHWKYVRYIQSLFLPFYAKDIAKADLLKTNQMWGSWVALIAGIVYRKKVIVRCGYEQFRFALLTKMPISFKVITYINSLLSYFLSAAIIITTEKAKEFIRKYFIVPQSKIHVVYNYVNTDKFCLMNKPRVADRLLFVGRLEKQKNIFALLDAVKKVGCGIDLYGAGEQYDEIESYIRTCAIDARLMGVVSNDALPSIYNQYEIYILPSLCEGMPKTLLEAMACGCAVIGSNIDGINNIIVHGKNGCLCDTTTAGITDAITLIQKDASLRMRIAQEAWKTIQDFYALHKIAEQEMALYHKVLA